MRREGRRQHGLVRTYRILPPPLNPRMVDSLTSPLTAGLFTKLPSKVHRKLWFSQVHWVRSNDIASPKMTGRVVTEPESGPVSNQLGFPATGIDEGGEAEIETVKIENDEDNREKEDGGSHHSHDDDVSMSFCDVGMMMMVEHVLDEDEEEEEEDGWCLV